MPKVNTRAKGDRYYKKVKDWLEGQGYTVAKLEGTKMAFVNGKLIPIRFDIWASDGIAANDTESFLFQVKSNATDVSRARHAYEKVPSGIRKVIYLWIPRAKEPRIYEEAY